MITTGSRCDAFPTGAAGRWRSTTRCPRAPPCTPTAHATPFRSPFPAAVPRRGGSGSSPAASASRRSSRCWIWHAGCRSTGRWSTIVELFTDTAELRLPDPPRSLEPVRLHHGRAGVRTAMSALAQVARTEHAIVGEVYAPGDHADYGLGRITCIAHHWTVTGTSATDVVWHLRYDDEYARTPRGWRIHGRALTINAIETPAVRRVRAHPGVDRAAGAAPSAASPEPSARRTTPPGRSPGTP